MRRRAVLRGLAACLTLAGMMRAARALDETVRVLVLGDSQAQGLAGGVQRLLRHDRRFRVLDRSKIGTGLLSRAYDWISTVRALPATEHPDVAVVMFGANDRPRVRGTDGSVIPGLSFSFERVYGERVREIVQSLRDANVPVIWVGHPTVRDPKYADDMAFLNRIFADEASAAGADYVPIWDLFAGAGGIYEAYGKGVDGETTRLRADDGVHLTVAGYDVLARYLLPHIEADLRGRLAKAMPSPAAELLQPVRQQGDALPGLKPPSPATTNH